MANPRQAAWLGVLATLLLAPAPTLAATTERVSVGAGGAQATAASGSPAISADGRYVAFVSDAALAPADANGLPDVYLRDRVSRTTELVSAAPNGRAGNAPSGQPSIDADGTRVAFVSAATNLAGPTNGRDHTYLRDRVAGVTSKLPGGDATESPHLSGDGLRVAYDVAQYAPFVVLYDLAARQRLLSESSSFCGSSMPGSGRLARLSANGRVLAWVQQDLCDYGEGGAWLVDADTLQKRQFADRSVPPVLSGDGVLAAWDGDVLDWRSGAVVVSVPGEITALGRDGRFVTYVGGRGRSVVFRLDRTTGERVRVSASLDGHGANGSSFDAATSSDGRVVAYSSAAGNLVAGDTNHVDDVFATVLDGAPSIPSGVTATRDGRDVVLRWTASTGDAPIAAYHVLRNGADVGTTATTSFRDAHVPTGPLRYRVYACDAEGACGAASPKVTVGR